MPSWHDKQHLLIVADGIEGVLEALRDNTSPRGFFTVCHDLTEQTRAALIDGIVDMVISHPYAALAEAAVDAMVRSLEGKASDQLTQILLPFDIFVAENV